MTEDELKKYTVDFMNNETGSNESKLNSVLGKMLIKYAEIFQNRIVELEHQLTHRNCVDCSNHSSKLKMRTLELEKENAELREQLGDKVIQKLKDKADIVWKLKTANEQKAEQLTTAKQFIRDFLSVVIDYIDKEDKNYSYIEEGWKFLNEVDK